MLDPFSSPDAEHQGPNLYQSIIQQAPQAIALLTGEALIIEVANERILQLWGKTAAVIGLPVLTASPELNGQVFPSLLRNVLETGIPQFGNGVLAQLHRNGRLEDAWFDFSYTRLNVSPSGNYSVLVMATEVTDQYLTDKAIAHSEWLLQTLVASAPAAIALFIGRELTIKFPNRAFIDIVGKGPDIEGRLLRQVMPELTSGSQPFLKILDEVFTSGQMFQTFASRVDIVQNGVPTRNYYNMTYTPLVDKRGKVFAILNIAIDVSAEVYARKKVEETEAYLLGAIELAEVGTWTVEINTQRLTCSDRMAGWTGLPGTGVPLEQLLQCVDAQDADRLQEAIGRFLQGPAADIFDEEFTIVHQATGRRRLVRAQGRVVYDMGGAPVTFAGTARDITKERNIALELEQQILKSTHELASTVEELRVTNDDLAVSNELLIRSNEDLQSFAHVASHDLREPLRKIKTFLSRIESRKGDVITSDTLLYLERISSAADRMWDMVKGVLLYSTVNAGAHAVEKVDLNQTVAAVLTDLELVVSKTGAAIHTGSLPAIEGIGVLLHQLFYNLLANALKFVTRDVPPVIDISCRDADDDTVAITISDNGIGFPAEYAERIFETFTRLNSKDAFEGTGLGLALCRRIVERHHGRIRAESEVNKGTSFIVTLPVSQSQPFL